MAEPLRLGNLSGFQFLGIPPKGEQTALTAVSGTAWRSFQFLGIPPKGELYSTRDKTSGTPRFPISRDPPEGGTLNLTLTDDYQVTFPISRDPPEGGT